MGPPALSGGRGHPRPGTGRPPLLWHCRRGGSGSGPVSSQVKSWKFFLYTASDRNGQCSFKKPSISAHFTGVSERFCGRIQRPSQ